MNPRPLLAAGALLGIGMGGLVDGWALIHAGLSAAVEHTLPRSP